MTFSLDKLLEVYLPHPFKSMHFFDIIFGFPVKKFTIYKENICFFEKIRVKISFFKNLSKTHMFNFLWCLVKSRQFLDVKFGFLVAFYPYICVFMKIFEKKWSLQKNLFFLWRQKISATSGIELATFGDESESFTTSPFSGELFKTLGETNYNESKVFDCGNSCHKYFRVE